MKNIRLNLTIGRVVGTCDMDEKLGIGPNIKLTQYNDGYIRCRINSNFIGNVNVTFATRFNGESESDRSLYSIVGTENDLTNFQLIPKVNYAQNTGGSVMGGNTVTVMGGPFIAGETTVDVDGQSAQIISLSENSLSFAAPKETDGSSCPGFGDRGFLAKVWDVANSGIWQPMGAEAKFIDLEEALFEKEGAWTAHLEGYFRTG